MSLDNNSANNFKDFLDAIKPYLNYQPVDLSCMGIDAFQFSTDEKPVGMWTDRKLVYSKTFTYTLGSTSSNTWTDIGTLNDVDTVVGYFGSVNTNNFTLGANFFANPSIDISANKIKVYHTGMSNQPIKVVAFYTKTTDTALASGEKYAGLTANGEVIYERTISITTARNVTTNSWNVIDEADSWFGSVDQIMSGSVKRNNDCASMPCEFNKNNGHLRIDPWRNDYFNTQTRITVRYTKTS